MPLLPFPTAKLPTTGTLSWGFRRSDTHVHNGIDLPAPEGTPVYAAADGVVQQASERWEQGFSGYGMHVVLAVPTPAPARWLLYAHLSRVLVSPGQRVKAGQLIGAVGRTAFSAEDHTSLLDTGPHLHFEVSPRAYPQPSESARVDPVAWLGKGRTAAPTQSTTRSATRLPWWLVLLPLTALAATRRR